MIGHVINLDRAAARWQSVSRIAAERGLLVERLPAADGRAPWAAPAAARAGMLPAEVACFESHRRAWRRIAEGPDPAGLVLEDDVWLAEGITAVLESIEDLMQGLDLVKLNAHPRGMIVASRPVAEVPGCRLLRPAQGTSDSSAYVISRAFAAWALVLHADPWRALDLALFDPATGARIAQADPGLAVQQRHADFRFLDEQASRTEIQPDRSRPLPGARPRGWAVVRREAERFRRRRLLPAMQPLLNLRRPPEARLEFRRIRFLG
jgi:glycosyl transferase, family 25